MKSKKKNKRKFVDLITQSAPFYQSNTNKQSTPNKEQNSKIEEYQPPLEVLYSEYPNFSEDMIEDLYIEKQRNYFQTRDTLDMLSFQEEKENQIEDQKEESNENREESNQSNNELKPPVYEDINKYIQFTFDDDFSNNNFDINYFDNEYPIPNEHQMVNNQTKKVNEEYKSVFSSSNPLLQQTPGQEREEDLVIDEFLLDEYITFIRDAFPNYSRMDITKMICECDFDIDKTILQLFDCDTSPKELELLEEYNISNKEEIMNNFSSYNKYEDNLIDIDSLTKHNLQKKIEKEIKKINLKEHFAIGKEYEKECPVITEKIQNYNSQEIDKDKGLNQDEEYFLDKSIEQIQTKSIKDDLTKLFSKFPFEDEFTIKWVYYQYMDYSATLRYFHSNSKTPVKTGLKGIVDKMDQAKQQSQNKPIRDNYNNNYFSNFDKKQPYPRQVEKQNKDITSDVFSSIISQNPKKWQIDNNSGNINLNEYQSIRKKLIWQAQLAFSNKNYNDAKAIMAKARRYKYEINKTLENKKIEIFLKNNQQLAIENLYRMKEHCIDLHGLTVEESKIILNKKILDLRDKKEREGLNNITLCIITGIGSHSKNGIPVLLPELSAWLKNKLKIKTKVDDTRGMIRIMI